MTNFRYRLTKIIYRIELLNNFGRNIDQQIDTVGNLYYTLMVFMSLYNIQ